MFDNRISELKTDLEKSWQKLDIDKKIEQKKQL